jgi:hypothetical protein
MANRKTVTSALAGTVVSLANAGDTGGQSLDTLLNIGLIRLKEKEEGALASAGLSALRARSQMAEEFMTLQNESKANPDSFEAIDRFMAHLVSNRKAGKSVWEAASSAPSVSN